ncbi:MAG: anaerobic ribonucleoside-triphosphate reductase activating protein [Clostridia bacterium]|nr:anaerobic ribonucleoside-triphosphate reductase activating protein [Clostridia bacterium]
MQKKPRRRTVSNIPWPGLKISGVVEESITDGPGIRTVIFTQGCPHRCPGCHNPQTHDFSAGFYADGEAILASVAENPLIRGVTFSGGEPFCQAQALCELAQRLRDMGKNIWVYSGYTHEELLEKGREEPAVSRLLSLCDVLVDGPYLQAERDLTLTFCGSRNQRIIRLRE